MKFLINLLPKQYRSILNIGLQVYELADTPEERAEFFALARRIYSSMDTHVERRAALMFALDMFKDGKVTIIEWSGFGKKLGIFKSEG